MKAKKNTIAEADSTHSRHTSAERSVSRSRSQRQVSRHSRKSGERKQRRHEPYNVPAHQHNRKPTKTEPPAPMTVLQPEPEVVYSTRPCERQLMRPWMEDQINSGEINGLEWIDPDKTTFQVPWKHASRHGWMAGKDACLFERWAVHSGKYNKDEAGYDPKRWKANFRCALHSLPDVEEIKTGGVSKKGQNAIRVYRFLAHKKSKKSVAVRAPAPVQRPRRSRVSVSASEDDETYVPSSHVRMEAERRTQREKRRHTQKKTLSLNINQRPVRTVRSPIPETVILVEREGEEEGYVEGNEAHYDTFELIYKEDDDIPIGGEEEVQSVLLTEQAEELSKDHCYAKGKTQPSKLSSEQHLLKSGGRVTVAPPSPTWTNSPSPRGSTSSGCYSDDDNLSEVSYLTDETIAEMISEWEQESGSGSESSIRMLARYDSVQSTDLEMVEADNSIVTEVFAYNCAPQTTGSPVYTDISSSYPMVIPTPNMDIKIPSVVEEEMDDDI